MAVPYHFPSQNESVRAEYLKGPNYRIDGDPSKTRTAALYFSSNGLYYPDDISVFDEMIRKERYEWSDARNRIERASKMIYLRDLQKQFYLEGINESLPDLRFLGNFLRTETRGDQVVTIGSSAGGFAAIALGCDLNADMIYSFSGIITLNRYLQGNPEENPLVQRHRDDPAVSDYYDLTGRIRASNSDIFHFYSHYCEEDRIDYERVKEAPHFHPFSFDSNVHGITFHKFVLTHLLNMPKEDLIKLSEHYRGHLINPFDFALNVCGVKNTVSGLFELGPVRFGYGLIKLTRPDTMRYVVRKHRSSF